MRPVEIRSGGHAMRTLIAVCALIAASCSGPTAPIPPDAAHEWRGIADVDSYAQPGEVRLYWYTTTRPGCIDPVCPPEGPPIARVDVHRSSTGPLAGYTRIFTAHRDGQDSTIVTGLADGRPYWFRVDAHDRAGRRLLRSKPVMTVPGPRATPLTTFPIILSGDLSWSPDGNSIAYVDASAHDHLNVAVIDPSTSGTRLITSYGAGEEFLMDAAWSRDGRSIAFTHTPSRTNYLLDYRVWTVDLAAGSLQSVTRGPIDFDGAWGGSRWLYFCRGTAGPPNIPEIWRVDPSNPGSESALTADQLVRKYDPAVRGVDDLIVYAGGTVVHSLYLLSPAAGPPASLTAPDLWNDFGPSWAPDGRRVVFVSDRAGHDEVWEIDVASRVLTQLTRGSRGTDKQLARWSPDGGRLAVVDGINYQGRPGRLELYWEGTLR